ncbi:MAG: GNAT family N-acetyltransferase [Deltaproteobacteria bacterium]|nr:GNAT family N-acetyltransferase [Deltaproteobacteria bacterium]MBW2072205.1 GNAT family N-acetyltransferase [Deltaproteobacteria bacterium]
MTEGLYKECKLKDGTRVLLRPLVAEDQEKLIAFFQSLPEEERIFLRHDVADVNVIKSWTEEIDYSRNYPLLAFVDDKIVGDVTLHRIPYGWKRHMGTVRVVVAPEYHNKGLGTLLINEIVELAAEFGLEKLWAELPLSSPAAIAVFRKAGFSSKAVIEGLVKDLHGRNTDVVIMVCDVGTQYDR